MSAYNLLSDLRQAGVVVKASGNDRLVVDAPKGALTAEMRAALAEHKKELLAILTVTGEQHDAAAPTLSQARELAAPVAPPPVIGRPELVRSAPAEYQPDSKLSTEHGISARRDVSTAAQEPADSIEDKIRRLEQEAAQLRAQQEARRAEIEARQRLDGEIKRLEDEAKKVALAEESRRAQLETERAAQAERWQAEAAAQRKAAEEAELRQAEEERRAAQLEARRHAEEEIARRRSEEEIRKVEEQLASLRADEVNRRSEVTARWQAEDERWRAELETRKAADEQAARQFAENERQRSDWEAKSIADDELARNAAEARARSIKEQVAGLRAEQENYSAAEARRKAEEAANQRAAEEARMHAEENARAAAEAAARADEQARRQAEEEARVVAEEQARREQEASHVAEQEARLRALEEERQHLEQAREAELAARPAEPEWFQVNVNDDKDEVPGSGAPLTLPALEAKAESEGTFIDYQEFEAGVQLHPTANFPSGKNPSRDFQLLEADPAEPSGEGAAATLPNATLSMLGSESVNERCAAVTALPQVGGEDAFTHISGAFDDPAVEVRNAAARAMFSFQSDRAASFTRALREGTPERRRRIGAALASSGLATEAIGNLTGESREKTYDAFSLLFLMSKAGEVQPLLRAIEEHSNIEVRLAVVKLLALSGQHDILPAFRRLAVRGSLPPEVRSSVMEAIYQISSQATADAHSAA
ncbi:MAG: TubC N-terminal docking domain [Blastocatellia bacterium]|jgi:chemotaxis protein histidine kinase CheA|nr:TubC N-terminal docking domain [Blastocatellia bacterium]